ncbi:MAG TPA: methyltransferase domain-containing protein [Solirubrobacteraceae bacterium]|nr:methyltransferase domain-containing protein [Solirubrobacteraceae bacterium]
MSSNAMMVEQSDERDGLRARLAGMWTSVAEGWSRHAEYADARGAQTAQRMLELAQVRAGDRVLELACGPGGLGLAAAERVGPGGEVVLTDVVEEMTTIAAARAGALGLGNVGFRRLDLERIDEPDAAYDVVLCREGLMFALEPARAVGEIRRVLRPGGRVALAVWGPRERNPWLGLVMDVVSAQTGAPVPPPGIPGPFALGDADELQRLLDGAGLADVRVGELSVPLRSASFDEWWERISALAGPLSAILAGMPDPAVQALRRRARAAVRDYESASGGLDFPGVALIASGRRVAEPAAG